MKPPLNPRAETALAGLQAILQNTISSATLDVCRLPKTNLRLMLLSEDYPRGPLPHDEMLAVLKDPA